MITKNLSNEGPFVFGDKDTDFLCRQKEFLCRQKRVEWSPMLPFTQDDKKVIENTLLASSANRP